MPQITRTVLYTDVDGRGRMEIGLQDGSTRIFGPGESFLSADLLPEGAVFDPSVHGHRSRALDDAPLETLFVRV